MNIKQRIKILDLLKTDLLNSLHNIVSIYVYGSTLYKAFGSLSDIDLIIVFEKKLSVNNLEFIKTLNQKYKNNGIKLDISIHTVDEMIGTRDKLFWHNNRAVFIQKEILMYGKLIYGKKLFDDNIFSDYELKEECIKVINSLKYNARKLMISSLDEDILKRRLLKLSLSSTIYALAFYDILPKNRDDICDVFDRNLNLKIKAKELLKLKMKNYGSGLSSLKVKNKVLNFLNELDSKVYYDFKKS